MTDRWNLTEAQQRLLNVIALLEEQEFIAMLQALAHQGDGNSVVELACRGLDEGLTLLEVFGPDGPLTGLLENNNIVLDAMLQPDRSVMLVIGTTGPDCDLYAWQIGLSPAGMVEQLELRERRNEWMREVGFSTTLCLS